MLQCFPGFGATDRMLLKPARVFSFTQQAKVTGRSLRFPGIEIKWLLLAKLMAFPNLPGIKSGATADSPARLTVVNNMQA